MDAVRELLDLVVRWIHVAAGIMWIGNSLLFNWLDRNLRPAMRPRDTSRGEIWLLHSGGFYLAEKMLSPGSALPHPLHWFKWQAYTTWLSGIALVVLVYFMSGAALLVEPAGVTPAAARLLTVGLLAGGWLAYEALWRSPLGRSVTLASVVSFALVIAAAYAMGVVFTGRATLLLTGALMGTLMAGNVVFHITPSQRAMVAAVERGAEPDARLSERAKLHSIHNNYMTFPVIVLMLSSHFPSFYGHDQGWLVVAVLLLTGAAVRHVLNIRFGWRPWIPALTATAAAGLVALYLLTHLPVGGDTSPAAAAPDRVVSFEEVAAVIGKRCGVCHSASPADRSFGVMPGGVAFDSPEQIRLLAPRIAARAVETQTMPPANRTWMTEEERQILGAWVRHPER